MNKHTPGPWRAGPNGGWGLGPINAVFTAESDLYGDLLASLQTVPVSPHMEANARLMAAAPDLLEFAHEVRRTGDTRLASMAIAVIARAERGA